MIDITNPTLSDALYLGLGMGFLVGLAIGSVVAFCAFRWTISGNSHDPH